MAGVVTDDLSENDINSQRGLWLDGSKAGCLLAAFFSFVTLCMLLCCNRWGGRQYSIIGTSAMSSEFRRPLRPLVPTLCIPKPVAVQLLGVAAKGLVMAPGGSRITSATEATAFFSTLRRAYAVFAFAAAMGMAGVGAFFGFLGPEVENIYTPHDGLFIAISSCALALISAIVSCLCLSDSYSYYDLA